MRTFGIMAAIAAGLFGIVWGLADYGMSNACATDGFGFADCAPNLHPVIAPAILVAAAVVAVVALVIADRPAVALSKSTAANIRTIVTAINEMPAEPPAVRAAQKQDLAAKPDEPPRFF